MKNSWYSDPYHFNPEEEQKLSTETRKKPEGPDRKRTNGTYVGENSDGEFIGEIICGFLEFFLEIILDAIS